MKFLVVVASLSIYHISSTKQLRDKRGNLIVVNEILIQLQIYRLQVNYVNPILYPVSVSGCPSPGRGLLCILIGDLIINSIKRSQMIETQHTN